MHTSGCIIQLTTEGNLADGNIDVGKQSQVLFYEAIMGQFLQCDMLLSGKGQICIRPFMDQFENFN